MKTIKILSFILVTVFMLSSCGSKEKNSDKSGESEKASSDSVLDGDWEIKRATGEMADMNIGVIYSFNGNKLSFGTASYKNPGTTEITETTFTFQAEGNDLKFTYDYKLEGDTLIVSMQNSGQTFYLTKK